MQKWGIHPQQSKTLITRYGDGTGTIHFNYWDYMKAWKFAFYYQNPKRKHSWFFKLCSNMGTEDLPNWFVLWWSRYGPQPDYLPPQVAEEWENYSQNYPQKNIQGNKLFLLFIIESSIPWIWRWDVQRGKNRLGFPTLERSYQYRWWAQLSVPDVVTQIKEVIKNLPKPCPKDQGQKSQKNSNPWQFIA